MSASAAASPWLIGHSIIMLAIILGDWLCGELHFIHFHTVRGGDKQGI